MLKYRIFILMLSVCLIQSACQDRENIREIKAFRTISIPVQWLGEGEMAVEKLTLQRGGVDELPQGPISFDVLPNGSFVIADQLQRRIVRYDSLGLYLGQTPVGMRISSVRLGEDGTLIMRKLTSGVDYMINDDAQITSVDTSLKSRSLPPKYEVKKTEENKGKILATGARSANAQAIDVSFKSDSTQMISMQFLGVDDSSNPLVALETTLGGDTIDIIKIVRKYAEQGEPMCQFQDIRLDYFVHPKDEFRVNGNYVYQFIPREFEVMIKVWDTSEDSGTNTK